jgi:undecaprenyl-diphosphatase
MFEKIQNIDLRIVEYIYLHRPKGADSFLIWSTNNATLIAFSFIFVLILFYLIKKKQKYLYAVVNISLAIGIGAIISSSIKLITKRHRPYEVSDTMTSIVESGGYSFPSGHTTEVFVLTLSIFLLLRNKYLRYFSLVWAIFIAYTRIAMGVHYPLDVLGGMIVGSATAYYWNKWNILKPLFKNMN